MTSVFNDSVQQITVPILYNIRHRGVRVIEMSVTRGSTVSYGISDQGSRFIWGFAFNVIATMEIIAKPRLFTPTF